MSQRIIRWAVLPILLLLAGCSQVQFVYNQLDWLAPSYLDTYVGLNDEQYAYLESEVETLRKWHCSSHLAEYARLLRNANADLHAHRMTTSRLAAYTGQIQQFWFEIVQHALPAITGLLRSASDEQVAELFALFRERNEDARERFAESNRTALMESYQERMADEFRRWFGSVTPEQERLVAEWSERFQLPGKEGLAFRIDWQNRLRSLLAKRADRAAMLAGIEVLVMRMDALRSPSYSARLEQNRTVTIELLVNVGQNLTAPQLEHLAREVDRYASDFEALACVGAAAGTITGGRIALSGRDN